MTAGEQGQWVREQPCQAISGKDGVLRLFLDSDRIGVHTPPGGVGLLTLAESRPLQDLLGDAVLELAHRLNTALVFERGLQRSYMVTDYNDRTQPLVISPSVGMGTVSVRVGQLWFTTSSDTADAIADGLRHGAAVSRSQEGIG